MFNKELEFYKRSQEELSQLYKGKVLVIKGEDILGAYLTPIDAYSETIKKYAPGTFMIQPCKLGTDAYTVTISTLNIITSL